MAVKWRSDHEVYRAHQDSLYIRGRGNAIALGRLANLCGVSLKDAEEAAAASRVRVGHRRDRNASLAQETVSCEEAKRIVSSLLAKSKAANNERLISAYKTVQMAQAVDKSQTRKL